MNSQLGSRIKSFRGPQQAGGPLRRGAAGFGDPILFEICHWLATAGKPICEPGITLVASGLPTFYSLPLAKRPGFA
jgi:hypothetical protein